MVHPLQKQDRISTFRRNPIDGSFVLVCLDVTDVTDKGFSAEFSERIEHFSWNEFERTVFKYDPSKPDKEGYWWVTSKNFKSRLIIEIEFSYRDIMVWIMGKNYKFSWKRFNKLFGATDLEYISRAPQHSWDYIR